MICVTDELFIEGLLTFILVDNSCVDKKKINSDIIKDIPEK